MTSERELMKINPLIIYEYDSIDWVENLILL